MYARLTKMHFKIDRIEHVLKLYNDSIIPAVKSQKGFKGAYLLTNRNTGKAISCTLWDSEEDAVANEESGYYQEQINKIKDFLTAPPDREGYEVSVQV